MLQSLTGVRFVLQVVEHEECKIIVGRMQAPLRTGFLDGRDHLAERNRLTFSPVGNSGGPFFEACVSHASSSRTWASVIGTRLTVGGSAKWREVYGWGTHY